MANAAAHDGHSVGEHGTEVVSNVDFDQPAQKGWVFFTKFLTWNIISCVVILLFIGVLTVWS